MNMFFDGLLPEDQLANAEATLHASTCSCASQFDGKTFCSESTHAEADASEAAERAEMERSLMFANQLEALDKCKTTSCKAVYQQIETQIGATRVKLILEFKRIHAFAKLVEELKELIAKMEMQETKNEKTQKIITNLEDLFGKFVNELAAMSGDYQNFVAKILEKEEAKEFLSASSLTLGAIDKSEKPAIAALIRESRPTIDEARRSLDGDSSDTSRPVIDEAKESVESKSSSGSRPAIGKMTTSSDAKQIRNRRLAIAAAIIIGAVLVAGIMAALIFATPLGALAAGAAVSALTYFGATAATAAAASFGTAAGVLFAAAALLGAGLGLAARAIFNKITGKKKGPGSAGGPSSVSKTGTAASTSPAKMESGLTSSASVTLGVGGSAASLSAGLSAQDVSAPVSVVGAGGSVGAEIGVSGAVPAATATTPSLTSTPAYS